MLRSNPKLNAWLALALLVPAPTVGVTLAMLFEPTRGTLLGMAAYSFSKVWILVVPFLWLLIVDRGRISFSPARQGGLGVGLLLGVAIALAIGAGYLVFKDVIDRNEMRKAAEMNGLHSLTMYLAVAIYLTLINSLLEEYVWRWFVFRKCEALLPGMAAVVVSALLFGLHHFLALYAQAGLFVAALGTFGVCVGGCAWSWCYLRYRSVWPGYLSHVVADAAVFIAGWHLLFGD